MLNRAKDRNLQFESMEDETKFANQLVNSKTLQEWIKCAFNGNILEVQELSQSRQRARMNQTMQFDSLCNNKSELMRRIHKLTNI